MEPGVYRPLGFFTNVRLEATAFVNPQFLNDIEIGYVYQIPATQESDLYADLIDGNVAVGEVRDGLFIVPKPHEEVSNGWTIDFNLTDDVHRAWVDANIPRLSTWSINLSALDKQIQEALISDPQLKQNIDFDELGYPTRVRVESLDTLTHWQDIVENIARYRDASSALNQESIVSFDWSVSAEAYCRGNNRYSIWLNAYAPTGMEWLQSNPGGDEPDLCKIEISGNDFLMKDGGADINDETFRGLFNIFDNYDEFQAFFEESGVVQLPVESIDDLRAWRNLASNSATDWSINFPYKEYVFIGGSPMLLGTKGQRVVSWSDSLPGSADP
ncbi:MAG: hypothetical protein OXJ90_01525 [Spirochaetaceae bacterium]|nr:hypothetical protein [Spirochaetaceae bacterium]